MEISFNFPLNENLNTTSQHPSQKNIVMLNKCIQFLSFVCSLNNKKAKKIYFWEFIFTLYQSLTTQPIPKILKVWRNQPKLSK